MKYKKYKGITIDIVKGSTCFATFTKNGKKCSNAIIDGATEEEARLKAKLYLDKCNHYNRYL